jgi:hypothetical protein
VDPAEPGAPWVGEAGPELEAKTKKYEDQDRERQERTQLEERNKLTAGAREQYQAQIIEALDTGKLPKTNFTVQRLAHWMQVNRKNNFNAPTAVLVAQVEKEIHGSLRASVQGLDGEGLIRVLGDELIDVIRKYDLEQLRKRRAGQNGQGASEGQPNPGAGGKTEDRPTSSEVAANIRRLQRRGW